MVAGGVGLAPFVTLAEAIRATGGRARLFYGARRASELYYVELFERMGVEVVLTTEDGSRGHKGYVTGALDAALRSATRTNDIRLYVCGPTPMMRAVAELATAHGTACDVSLEQVMGCGLGGCYSCVVLARDGSGAASLPALVHRGTGVRRVAHRLERARALTWTFLLRSAR